MQMAAKKTPRKRLKKAELKEVLDNYGADLQAMTKIKPQMFETLQIATMISTLPSRKWNAAQAIVNATILKKDAEQTVKRERAKAMLIASHSRDAKGLTNAEDRKAFVDDQVTVQNAEIDLINADAELSAAKLGYECLDDLFTAGKKIMDWLSEQDRATQQYNRFADEAKRHGAPKQ